MSRLFEFQIFGVFSQQMFPVLFTLNEVALIFNLSCKENILFNVFRSFFNKIWLI